MTRAAVTPARSRRGRWWSALSVAVSLAVLAVLAGGVSDASTLIDRIPIGIHLAAIGCVLLSLLVRALRLAHIGRSCGQRVRPSCGARAHLWAEALAAVTPARTGGDPARVWVLRRDGVPPVSGAALVAGEVVGDLMVVITLALTLAVISPAVRIVSLLAAAFASVIVLTLLVASAIRRRTARDRVPRPLARLGVSRRRWRGLRLQGLKFRRALRLVRRAPVPAQLLTLALSSLNVGARLAILPVLALPLAADYSPLRLVAWPLLFLYPGAALPFPGGGGVIEMGFAASLAADFGADELAVVLVWWRFYTHHLLAATGALAIGVSALKRRARACDLRSVARPDPGSVATGSLPDLPNRTFRRATRRARATKTVTNVTGTRRQPLRTCRSPFNPSQHGVRSVGCTGGGEVTDANRVFL